MKDYQIKLSYIVILSDPLNTEEVVTLKELQKLYGLIDVRFAGIKVHVDYINGRMEPLAALSTWLSHIGADGDIFCIQEIKSMYTNKVSPEILDVLR